MCPTRLGAKWTGDRANATRRKGLCRRVACNRRCCLGARLGVIVREDHASVRVRHKCMSPEAMKGGRSLAAGQGRGVKDEHIRLRI